MEWELLVLCLLFAAILALIVQLHDMVSSMQRMLEEQPEEPPIVDGGMNLMLLKKENPKKARRFTDKSRDWLTAREAASRR